ncbi:Intracellular exo-alpha-L-arabinofuranosidase 2 [compost metagenome]
MYQVHMDNQLLDLQFDSPEYTYGDVSIPQVSVSASQDSAGAIHLTACNLHHEESAKFSCHIEGALNRQVSGRILTHTSLNAHNTFEQPDLVAPVAFEEADLLDGVLEFELPPASVLVLSIN